MIVNSMEKSCNLTYLHFKLPHLLLQHPLLLPLEKLIGYDFIPDSLVREPLVILQSHLSSVHGEYEEVSLLQH